nr:hypothetical protein [Tanacetum cinerariifolium]
VKTVNDEVRIQALADGKRVNIKEFFIRRTLRLDDVGGSLFVVGLSGEEHGESCRIGGVE